eukprot:TRINITY_DN59438_c0_g1_i1.p1 TRINITY_DN59438_c0_g1~~TRINITY_DN59438_c0_g1_i1.p1  ORF type:complete len:481 (-),score=135.01 TRINITY_DN59438_c0_g1_i1:105-1469(-)
MAVRPPDSVMPSAPPLEPPEVIAVAEADETAAAAQRGALLAAFAAGCLGLATAREVGNKLGLMGSAASVDEVMSVLQHLETLANQRAAKLAGLPAQQRLAATSADAGEQAGATSGATCSAEFGAAVREACCLSNSAEGVGPALFTGLPRDARGNVDLLGIFGLAPPSGVSTARNGVCGAASGSEARGGGCGVGSTGSAAATAALAGFPAEYVERAADLPKATDEHACLEARRRLVGAREADGGGVPASCAPDESQWQADVGAINCLRASLLANGAASAAAAAPTLDAALLVALARRCGSRRPALTKTSLRALGELAEDTHCSSEAWQEAAGAAVEGCLAAVRTTKVAARLAEDTLALVCRRLSSGDASASAAAAPLASAVEAAASARPPQPPVVGAGLRALAPLAAPLVAAGSEAEAVCATVRDVCNAVLACRVLGAAYGDARAILQALKVEAP